MPLQKQFRGLPDALGLFQGGTIPFELDQTLKASLDVEKWLMEPIWQFQQESQVHAIGARVTVDIPADEVWILWHMSGITTIPLVAGNAIALSGLYLDQGVAGRDLILSLNHQNNTFQYNSTGFYGQFACNFPGGLWCMDGSIGYIVTGRTGVANTAIDWGFQYSKFKR